METLSAHVIDMARFITGEEITEVIGSISETFIKEREIPAQGIGRRNCRRSARGPREKMGKSDVDDATVILARLDRRWNRQLRGDGYGYGQSE